MRKKYFSEDILEQIPAMMQNSKLNSKIQPHVGLSLFFTDFVNQST
jgi:hypothetical protein